MGLICTCHRTSNTRSKLIRDRDKPVTDVLACRWKVDQVLASSDASFFPRFRGRFPPELLSFKPNNKLDSEFHADAN